jgi:hypothetical protein
MPEPNLEIAVECIDCGQDVCVHQQKVIREFESRLREVEAELREARVALGYLVAASDPFDTNLSRVQRARDRARGVLERGR